MERNLGSVHIDIIQNISTKYFRIVRGDQELRNGHDFGACDFISVTMALKKVSILNFLPSALAGARGH
jgi:hypothetical protein